MSVEGNGVAGKKSVAGKNGVIAAGSVNDGGAAIDVAPPRDHVPHILGDVVSMIVFDGFMGRFSPPAAVGWTGIRPAAG